MYEKEGDYVAHVKFTVLLMPSGTQRITAPTVDLDQLVTSDKTLPDDLLKILTDYDAAVSAKKDKKKKKKKKKKKN